MMTRNKNMLRNWLFVLLGIGLMIAGILLDKNSETSNQVLATIPYLLIGLGCGIFGHFMGNIMKYFSTRNNEELERQIEIEKKDERNILIAEKSKAKAYDLMVYLFAGMLIMFSLMRVDKLQILIIVAIYLSLQVYALYWKYKLEGQM